jgi:hypothetical protein
MTDTKPTREKPPALYIRNPDCTACGQETCHDGDGFYCEDCGINWPDPDSEGEWSDEEAAQCPSTHQPFALSRHVEATHGQKYATERCLLDAGHLLTHRSDEFTVWTDDNAVNGVTAGAE